MKTQIHFLFLIIIIFSSINFAQDSLFRTITQEFSINTEENQPNFVQRTGININGNSDKYILAWYENRNFSTKIYAQIFLKEGISQCANLVVTDSAVTEFNAPEIVINQAGEFAILWYQSDINGKIMIQKFDMQGNKIGNNACLIDSVNHLDCISSNQKGSFVIAYTDYYEKSCIVKYNYECTDIKKVSDINNYIYKICLLENEDLISLSQIGNNIKINSFNENLTFIKEQQILSASDIISINNIDSSKFAICWKDKSNHFYIQYIDSRENLLDSQIVLEIEGYPKIVFFEDGNFIVFQINRVNIGGEDSGITYGEYLKYQKFSHNGQKLSDIVNLNYFSYPYKYGKYYYNFIPIDNDKILSVWNEHNNIYLQNILESNNVKNPIHKITTNDSYSFQQNHDFTICNNGDLIIVYEEDKNGFGDIYLQKLDSIGNFLGNSHSITKDSLKIIKKSPMIASSSNNNIMICWVESINDEEKMFAQIQNSNSEQVINKFEVLSLRGIEKVKIKSFENKFIVSYNNTDGIFCKIYSHEGKHLYTNLFNNYIDNMDEKLKSWDIRITKLGKYLFYYNCYNTSENIDKVYGQFVDSSGNKLGEVFQINSNENLFDISDENTEKIPVSWLDTDNELNFRIVLSDCRFYSIVNFTEEWHWDGGGLPTIAIDENKNFVKYNKTYFQIFSNKGEKIGNRNEIYDLPISYDSATPVYKSKIIFKNNRLYIVREDLFELFDFDIKVKILELTKKITNLEGIPNVLPTTYALSQNYPNPFNPTTTISYQLPEKSIITLKVYDILGSEVAKLVNESREAGNHEITFDASKLSSGIYYYQIKAGNFVQSRKMLLIK